jgi:hypothetical protein
MGLSTPSQKSVDLGGRRWTNIWTHKQLAPQKAKTKSEKGEKVWSIGAMNALCTSNAQRSPA